VTVRGRVLAVDERSETTTGAAEGSPSRELAERREPPRVGVEPADGAAANEVGMHDGAAWPADLPPQRAANAVGGARGSRPAGFASVHAGNAVAGAPGAPLDGRNEAAVAIVRGERRDVRVPARPGWRPGDLIDGDALVRGFAGGDYPAPATEVARMPRRRLSLIQARAVALAALRRFFAARDFVEVETPLLVPSPGLEIHLDAVPAGGGYLITSPEYQMKRLLAAGFERIYQVCKCFRAGERGPHHASEFTMVEWYRGFADLDAIILDTEQLVAEVVRAVAGAAGMPGSEDIRPPGVPEGQGTGAHEISPAATDHASARAVDAAPGARGSGSTGAIAHVAGRAVDVTPPWPRMTVREAMRRWAGVEVIGDEPAPVLVAAVRAAGIAVADGTAWDDAFFAAFLAGVEPALAALDRPLILEDWPAPLAALARRRPDDPRTALRFEAYVGGIELANAFGELTDPVEQRARFEHDQATRRERGRAVYPIDDKLIAALAEGLPPSAGIALGFDRLVMLATGATVIDDVLTFSADEL
jgi:lysyl-tRNA synthetase class 2